MLVQWHLSAQIFRSVEKSTPLIRSSNSGISVITNEEGEILERIKLEKLADEREIYRGKRETIDNFRQSFIAKYQRKCIFFH